MSCTQDDVREIARRIPGAREGRNGFGFSVEVKGKDKGFVWAWRKRVHPKKPKVPQADVIVVPVESLDDKAALLAADPDKFFTEEHYNGYAAVLVRLDAVTQGELEVVLHEAWRCVTRGTSPSKPSTMKARPAKSKAEPARPPAKKAKPAEPNAKKAKRSNAKPRAKPAARRATAR